MTQHREFTHGLYREMDFIAQGPSHWDLIKASFSLSVVMETQIHSNELMMADKLN